MGVPPLLIPVYQNKSALVSRNFTGRGITDGSTSQIHHSSPSIIQPATLEDQPFDQHDSVAYPPRHPSPIPHPHPSQRQDLLFAPHHPSTIVSQQSSPSQQLTLSPHPLERPSMFEHAQGFTVSGGTFINSVDNSTTITSAVINTSSNFMKELLEKTIPGAASDSSARDPPPRCHPGTRLAILERCIHFIVNCIGEKKMRWVVGAAGVGKSAIMQSVAESDLPPISWRASIFFSIIGRNDGTKAIATLAYQFAAKCEPYRQFIEGEISRDPSLLQSLLSVQFNKFIVEPFIHHPHLKSIGRILIIIDGLDECNKLRTQRELLQLISDFCLTYPSSPIVWMIASRPEPHITSFFAQANVEAVYEKEEVLVDSDEAREDVEKLLRHELTNIQHEFSLSPESQWPSEQDFWKLASASGGLFVYANTVIKYIGDPDFGNPSLQLKDVVKVIDEHPLLDVPRDQHPMALLDALYAQILSKVPGRIMANTRKLLLALVMRWGEKLDEGGNNFLVLCNWLGLTYDDAYAAIRHLRSVLDVPCQGEAHNYILRFFHKSFMDYICDYTRSDFFLDIKQDAHQLKVQCTLRVLEEAPDGIDFGDTVDYSFWYEPQGLNRSVNFAFEVDETEYGTLLRDPGVGCHLSLTWPVDGGVDRSDDEIRLYLYKAAISNVVDGIVEGISDFCTEFFVGLLTTRFVDYPLMFPYDSLQRFVFDKSRRHEFMEQGILKQVPLKTLDFSYITWGTRLLFYRPIPPTPATDLSDAWNPSCEHERDGEWEEGGDEEWTTQFDMDVNDEVDEMEGSTCNFCCQRLERQLEDWKARSPDHPVDVLFTSTGMCFVEFHFVDPEDGMSEWTYWLVHEFSEEEREELGSTV
ncbi:hypothetical protein Agabi119p4_8909 [Agaricus bisporus var. burnettii]|uniref:Nephrocystin 3-like N-terminal domain-containing protein n=1 Tax=Agaricus bisporus var. burnettii TaxID=192524 RepID=A0A8H7C4M3_AGABI|nr:hypothetical protein Agabi119p4_8909 [Agaricus bisporus var. burnettii]